jgi:hypothetical protein
MAKKSAQSSAAERPVGKPFQPGKSGNPGGLTKEHREARKRVADALDAAFTRPDGTDGLVEAIVLGVADGDGTCIKLACEYRWGKPVQPVEIDPGKWGDDELRKAAAEVARDVLGVEAMQ